MSLLEDLVRNLAGPKPMLGNAQRIPAAKAMMPYAPAAKKIAPGYEQQAQEYENAFKDGSYKTNPIVVGPNAIDPKYFGYGPDTSVRPQLQPPRIKPHFGSYAQDGVVSVGGTNGEYGGTIGFDTNKMQPFANFNHNGVATDPLTELRKRLGF